MRTVHLTLALVSALAAVVLPRATMADQEPLAANVTYTAEPTRDPPVFDAVAGGSLVLDLDGCAAQIAEAPSFAVAPAPGEARVGLHVASGADVVLATVGSSGEWVCLSVAAGTRQITWLDSAGSQMVWLGVPIGQPQVGAVVTVLAAAPSVIVPDADAPVPAVEVPMPNEALVDAVVGRWSVDMHRTLDAAGDLSPEARAQIEAQADASTYTLIFSADGTLALDGVEGDPAVRDAGWWFVDSAALNEVRMVTVSQRDAESSRVVDWTLFRFETPDRAAAGANAARWLYLERSAQ